MLQFVRLIRAVWAILSHGVYLRRTLSRVPPEEQALYRARRQQIGGRLICRILGLKVTMDRHVPDGGAMLAVSNHFGIIDPVMIASCLPVAIVGKAEIARWPLIGWMASGYGLIHVHRERRTATADFVEELRGRLRSGVRVLVFPEGTTFPDGNVHPFKTGAFAAVAGMEDGAVLPLYLAILDEQSRPALTTQRAQLTWSKRSFTEAARDLLKLRGVRVHIAVGDPIPTVGLDRKQLAARAHEAVTALSLRFIPPDAPLPSFVETSEPM